MNTYLINTHTHTHNMKWQASLWMSDLSLTYSFAVVPEDRSFSSSRVTQGNDESHRILPTERNETERVRAKGASLFIPAASDKYISISA